MTSRHPACQILAEIEAELESMVRACPFAKYATRDGAISILDVVDGRGYEVSVINTVRRRLTARRIELGDCP